MNQVSNTVELAVPVEKAFAYYVDLGNLARMVPTGWNLRVLQGEQPLRRGSRFVFAVRPRMVPFEVRWQLQIVEYQQDLTFTEELERGPFSSWTHHHAFESLDGGLRCRVTDTIEHGPPTGFAAAVLGAAFVRSMLEEAFVHRATVLKRDLEGAGGGETRPLDGRREP